MIERKFMNLKDLIAIENKNDRSILLWKEGCFFRAYNRSLMRFVTHIKTLKTIFRYVKYLDETIVYGGFPEKYVPALRDICRKKCFDIREEDRHIRVTGFRVEGEDFDRWKMKQPQQRRKENKHLSGQEGGSVAPVVEKHYDLVKWMLSKIGKFPKDQRFLLADRIERHLLDVLELLIAAMYSSQRRELLTKVNLKLNMLRFLMRISKDMKYINVKAYDYFCRHVLEIGRMVGGWLKASE